ncbi:MAG: hypothetical protein UW68_C0029G0011 [Candidatus Collierbacteria bacterium GW2011_GWB1_44_6]|uniref:Uncharacterized protein n=2 Tax=Candidatus Collieribacteriota TaxID=1752725 RepID=A0A0G1JMT6_9BACT|nr:MAG: hypothetical protein UV68_C0007G0004 [Candidatus Collierbacteria bacterium GW2011_GWC2_43_12]KKT72670.1 MAG: hypothetical protein UW68_C0029G0011 [Candidatus Collierbacteria bacterium GW2011_GWB1_44_6]
MSKKPKHILTLSISFSNEQDLLHTLSIFTLWCSVQYVSLKKYGMVRTGIKTADLFLISSFPYVTWALSELFTALELNPEVTVEYSFSRPV